MNFQICLLLSYLLPVITCIGNNNVTKPSPQLKSECEDEYLDSITIKPIQKNLIQQHCANKTCVSKCCSEAKFFVSYNGSTNCFTLQALKNRTSESVNIDYSKFPVLKYNKMESSSLDFKSMFKSVVNKKLAKGSCTSPNIHVVGKDLTLSEQFHLVENGKLVLISMNSYYMFRKSWETNEFCYDYIVLLDENSKVSGPYPAYRTVLKANNSTNGYPKIFDQVNLIAIPISLVFLALLLIVYGFLRELRNLVGMVLMAYVGSLSVTFVMKVILLAMRQSPVTCKQLGVVQYYFIMSTFFWMNIMSFDIWWAFRGIRKVRNINRRGELVKFGWYCLYAYGVPLLLTGVVTAIDYSDLSKYPHIYKPHFERCFLIDDVVTELKHYLYIPLLVMLLLNLVFFLLTGYNLWLIKKDLSRYANEASKYNKQCNRFLVYIRLFVVMGITWIFEVLPLPNWLELAANIYNGLAGVAIFMVFVFKRKIFFKLCHRFKIENKLITDLRMKYDRKMSLAPSSVSTQGRKQSNLSENSEVSIVSLSTKKI